MAALLPQSRTAGCARSTSSSSSANKAFGVASFAPPGWSKLGASRVPPSSPCIAAAGNSTSTLTTTNPKATFQTAIEHNEHDLNSRHQQVVNYFPAALGVDDWISRVETVLSGYGFTGDNSIAMTNLCRDEVTAVLKDKIESVFGSSFNTNGLGGVLTCGVTGMKAGLSHSPICANGRERYVFFSFPHIAINSQGEMGAIARPGRAGHSCACGALAKCLGEFKAEGYVSNCRVPGVHDPLDPEYSILKQRLARRLRHDGTPLPDLNLATITAAAERTISNDLEFLIDKAVDLSRADYAVVTGVQIHNWSTELTPEGAPSLEFVAPTSFYVVINGEKVDLDMTRVPSLSPRQLMLLASVGDAGSGGGGAAVTRGAGTTLQALPLDYLIKHLGGAALPAAALRPPGIGEHELSSRWQSDIEHTPPPSAYPGDAPTMESLDQDYNTSFFAKQAQLLIPELHEEQQQQQQEQLALPRSIAAHELQSSTAASSNGSISVSFASEAHPSFDASPIPQGPSSLRPRGPFSHVPRSIEDSTSFAPAPPEAVAAAMAQLAAPAASLPAAAAPSSPKSGGALSGLKAWWYTLAAAGGNTSESN